MFHDLSLSEIAEAEGISRQGVHDLVRRCDRILEDYEDKLHLLRKFSKTREQIEQIRDLADSSRTQPMLDERMKQIEALCAGILAGL